MGLKQHSGPRQAFAQGNWVKWIGGASNHDLAALEDLAALAALAGAHCLDVAADAAVVSAVRRGIAWAQQHGLATTPWLMVSLSDGEDPHFRKAFLILTGVRPIARDPASRFARPWQFQVREACWRTDAMAVAAACPSALLV